MVGVTYLSSQKNTATVPLLVLIYCPVEDTRLSGPELELGFRVIGVMFRVVVRAIGFWVIVII